MIPFDDSDPTRPIGLTHEEWARVKSELLPRDKPSPFDGGENDPLIKSGALKQWDEFEPMPSRFSLFIPMELDALNLCIVGFLSVAGSDSKTEEILYCLQAEIKKEQERIALCSK